MNMNIMSEVRKWLPLTLITVATLLGVLFTYQFIDRPAPPQSDHPLRALAE